MTQTMQILKQIDERIAATLIGLVIGLAFTYLVGRALTLLILTTVFLIGIIFILMIGAKAIFSKNS